MASPDGTAFIRQSYRLKRKVLRRAKVVVLTLGGPNGPVEACGRFEAEYSGDGNDW